jgi:general secretion pathway protein C
MSMSESLIANHVFVPTVQSKWQHYVALIFSELTKISLGQWQFFIRFLLVICLSFSLSRLFWLVVPAPRTNSEVNISNFSKLAEVSHSSTASSRIDIEQLKSLSLFGKEDKVVKNTPITIHSAETSLNLSLMGVIASNLEPLSRAIIAVSQKPDIYAVGAALPVGAGITLVGVMTDRVIINNNGQFEALFLYQNNANHKSNVVSSADSASLTREQEEKMLEWQADHAEPEAPPARQKPVVYSTDQAITEVGRSMLDVVSMSVYQESGAMAGYKISPGRDEDKFKALGLKPGDVVVAINGWPMSDPEKIAEMYQELGSTNSATLQIKRGAHVMSVDVALQ